MLAYNKSETLGGADINKLMPTRSKREKMRGVDELSSSLFFVLGRTFVWLLLGWLFPWKEHVFYAIIIKQENLKGGGFHVR